MGQRDEKGLTDNVEVVSPEGLPALVTLGAFLKVHEGKGFRLADELKPKKTPRKKAASKKTDTE